MENEPDTLTWEAMTGALTPFQKKALAVSNKYIIFEMDLKNYEVYKLIPKFLNTDEIKVINIKGQKTQYFEYYTTQNISIDKTTNIYCIDTGLPENERVSKITTEELLRL